MHLWSCFSDTPASTNMAKEREEVIIRQYLRRKGYTDSIINRIMYPDKRPKKYSREEISNALALNSVSAWAYETMRRNKLSLIPLPHPFTLNVHLKHFLCSPGLQSEFFAMLADRMASEEWNGRQSVMVFDEMHVKEVYEYEPRLKRVVAGYKTVQVVMLRYSITQLDITFILVIFFRGAISPWKQIIYFDFDKEMSKSLLFKLIEKCEFAYSPVRAVICDMGNKKVLSQLGVNMRSRKFFFPNPFQENRNVYIFPDMCHCVKNMRNHTLDYGMYIKQGDQSHVALTKGQFSQLISSDGTDFKFATNLLTITWI